MRIIAAVEFRPTSATLHTTNFFVYAPSATFRAIVWREFQCSAWHCMYCCTKCCNHAATLRKKKMLCAILRAMLHHVFAPLQCFLPNVWQTVSKVLLKYPHLTISLHSMYSKNFLKRSCEIRTELVKFVASEVHTIWCNVVGSNEVKQCEKKIVSLVFGHLCNAKMWCIDLFSDPFFPDATRHLPKNRIEVFALLCRFILR